MEFFGDKLRRILYSRGISTVRFELETGIARRIFYEERPLRQATIMAIAYYLDMEVEELVEGTNAELFVTGGPYRAN